MPAYTQKERAVRIFTPLGGDVLLFGSMKGREALGRPFEYELVLWSEQEKIPYDKIIGQNVTITVNKPGDQPRYFNGYISRFAQTGFEKPLAEYRATMVPWLWFLTRSADCRIFQNLSIPEIIQQVFKDHGFSDFKDRLQGDFKKWEYCVQYRETAFNFVTRLMEQEGIYYFVKHQDGKHDLVLCNTSGSHLEFQGYEELTYRPARKSGPETESLWHWTVQHEVQTGTSAVRDFDFTAPRRSGLGSDFKDRSHAGSQFEQFDYLGEMDAECVPSRYSRLRLESWQAEFEVYHGIGNARGICTGVRFNLKAHPRSDLDMEYLTVATELRIESPGYLPGQGSEHEIFEANLRAIPVSQEFRLPRVTPKPFVQGPQTAMVVGAKGEEIFTDKYGRVKVQFHWDRYGKADENSSCWIRVAQVWAGKQWGGVYTPRVGQEVIVDFLEGDPDRPIITGRVYNGAAMTPYALPDNKTLSTIKSNSSKGSNGFNEIRFEDKKGSEQIFLHAEKDQEIRIKNDLKEWVGNESHQIIKKNQFEAVEGNKNTSVKGDRLSKIEGDHGETVKGNHHMLVDGAEHLTVKGADNVKVSGDANFKTDKNLNQEAGMKISIKSGQDFHGKAGMNFAMDAGMEVHLKAGVKVVIEGGVQVSLKAGSSFVDIGPAGVSISGPMVMINSGGSAASGSGSSPTAPVAPEAPDPPAEAKEAVTADPGSKDEPPPAPQPPKPTTFSSQAKALQEAAADGTPFCEECEKAKEQQAAGGGA